MRNTIHLILMIFIALGCKHQSQPKHLFTLMPSSVTGVTFNNELTETDSFNIIEYLYFNNGAGVSAGDIDNDGLIDLYFSSNQEPGKLYLNKGKLRFEDITGKAKVAGTGDWKTGVTMADVNGDGLLDIYICHVSGLKGLNGHNELFINQGNHTFTEQAREYGLDFSGYSTQAAFFDYDRDGDLDMYLLNHSVHTSRSYGDSSLRFDKDSLAGDRLFRNDLTGDRRVFHEVTDEAGIYSSQIGYGLGISISDINNDGWPDVYISNDFHENDYLYINNANGTFSEKLTEFLAHTSRSSMGNDIADINNDGLPDIMVLDMLPDNEKIRKQSGGEDEIDLYEFKRKMGYNNQYVRNTLQLNLGEGLFSEIGLYASVHSTDWSWSPLFCDFDNDGWKDLFITNGIYRRANDLDYVRFLTGENRFLTSGDVRKFTDKELYEKMPLQPAINLIFKNNGDLTFTRMSEIWGFDIPSFSNGAAYADLDNDGDPEIIVNNIIDKAFIYRNNSESIFGNHSLSIDLRGSSLNPKAVGTRVYLYADGKTQMAEQYPVRGFMSSSAGLIHFGTGNSSLIDSVLIKWPDGSEQTLQNVQAGRLSADIRNGSFKKCVPRPEKSRLFSQVRIKGLSFHHSEDSYMDFRREPLIPHSLSVEGPALAVSDVNGDGLDDLFAGGAKGQQPVLFIQKGDGSFTPTVLNANLDGAFTDITDAVFFDADGDKDYDLFIVHGGNEFQEGNPLLTDLLMINDGKGNFSRKNLFLSHNGSCVRPCDFDNDKDIDLFVGSRSVPGFYGLSPKSYLLKNDGRGQFVIADETDITEAGMVTDAVWFDYDMDGDQDLAITGEWMNIKIFRNENGHFTDVRSQADLEKTSGWWNCIYAVDIDLDGDPDLICGNLGLNSILKASEKEPLEMYVNDFDNNGTPDQIICSYENGHRYPFASFDELGKQIPMLRAKYTRYSDFGGKTTEEIFGMNILQSCLHKTAVMLESCIFINEGNGKFSKSALPKEAQFSPVRGILVKDFSNDSIPDIVLSGNDYSAVPSIGRYDAGFGLFIPGIKEKSLTAFTPSESGLIIKGDARRMVTMKIAGKTHVIAGINSDSIRVFRVNQ